MTQSNMQAAFIAELQKKVEAQANEFKLVQEQLKAMATANAADPNPKSTARRTLVLALPWPSRQLKPPNPQAKPHTRYPTQTLTLTPRHTRWRCLPI